ncbi:MAG: bifunctional riboflavin kinase/FAD synthetase [Prevotella sp.]|nr:bifunctional riboflavin kinase/FAD synthetase [Prevotella sp.]
MRKIIFHQQSAETSAAVATIGFFDGVHLGHRYLIDQMKAVARREGLLSTVVTFELHPRQVLCPDWQLQLLSTLDEKIRLLAQTGIDQIVVLPFDAQMAALSAHDFMQRVLCEQLAVRHLVIGYDNRFGHRSADSSEGFDDYVGYGREFGLTVVQACPFDAGDIRVSSSKIRKLLSAGNVRQAAVCLGRHYELSGTVVGGEHVGTGMGFPTANLQLDDVNKMVPAAGAYAVAVSIEGTAELLKGMMNIGSRPTFDGSHQTLETNILHFSGNVYGRKMSVRLVERLRPEKRFDSREALMSQLSIDAQRSEEILNQLSEI